MILDSLNIAASGLNTQQSAINVVANNIANANTPGYSRQVADIATLSSQQVGNLNLGNGVTVGGVKRIVDPMINKAVANNGAQQGYWNTLNTGLNSVGGVFGSLQSTGLSSALNNFFLSWQQLSNNPQDNAQKANVRAKSQTLISNLADMNKQLVAAQNSANSQIDSQIQQVNQLLDNIASLSKQINQQGASGTANTLLDKRDQAISKLSKLIPVQQVSTGNGGMMLQTVSGDLLTGDGVARHLARGAATAGGFAGLAIAQTGQPVNIGTTGSIAGLIDLRDNKLGSYIKQVNSLAENLAFSVNQIHASANSGTASTALTSAQTSNPTLALNDPAQQTPFAGQIKSGSFKINVYNGNSTATPSGGTVINITAGVTTMANIVTSLNAVSGISASLDAGNHLNITAAAGSSFTLSGDSSNVLAAYEMNSFFTGSGASTLKLSAAIQNNPSAINTGGVDSLTSAISSGDNSAALGIMKLQNQALSFGGGTGASLNDRTTTLTAQYGNDVATSLQQQQYSTAEGAALTAQQKSISGVSTDQALVSMLKFQQAYNASAKVITTTNTMMASLMGLIR